MEVLGASFSNLQLAQQSYSLAQSDGNVCQPNVPATRSANLLIHPSALPVQTDKRTAPTANQTSGHSRENCSSAGCHHRDHTIINPPSTANDTAASLQVWLRWAYMSYVICPRMKFWTSKKGFTLTQLFLGEKGLICLCRARARSVEAGVIQGSLI